MDKKVEDKIKLTLGCLVVVFLMSIVARLDECKVCEPFNVHTESITSKSGIYYKE